MKKIRTEAVDWVNVYNQASAPIWKQAPHHYTTEAVNYADGSIALDLGCGEGHDAIELARNGYQVEAVDISDRAIGRMLKQAGEYSKNIQGMVADVAIFKPTKCYDIVVSYGFLHFVGEQQHQTYIKNLQEATSVGGVHAFYTFGGVGNFHDLAAEHYWFPSRASLAALYADWEILHLDERTVEMFIRGDNDQKLYNSLVKILARKKS